MLAKIVKLEGNLNVTFNLPTERAYMTFETMANLVLFNK